MREGSVLDIELKRSPASFPVDEGLYCDPLLSRYHHRIVRELRKFDPDVIHITGPGDMGILGFWVSNTLRIPMAASWHTNLHEYAGRRLDKTFGFAPGALRHQLSRVAEAQSLRALVSFYRLAHFVLAPNASMVAMLEQRTTRPAYLLSHGVDYERFRPERRNGSHGPFTIGYVGRLTPEKNVRAFAALEQQLIAAGIGDFRFLLVGEGAERPWLERHLRFADMPGTLRGDSLAAAFAGMDTFVFPSRTDTFGLVVLEAMASGVPVVVSDETGARVQVQDGVSGFVGSDFAAGVRALMECSDRRRRMGEEARRHAESFGWRGVFEDVYRTYAQAFLREEVKRRMNPRTSPVYTA